MSTFWRDEGFSLGGTPAYGVDLVGADAHPEVLAPVLAESLVAQQSFVAGQAKDGGNPKAGRERTRAVGGLALHLHLHANRDLVPAVGHRSLRYNHSRYVLGESDCF